MELVLDDQVGGTKERMVQGPCRRLSELGLRVGAGIVHLGGLKPMPLADAVDLPEEHLDLALPWHLREFVDRGDEECRESSVDLLIDDHNRETLAAGLSTAEGAVPELVAAVGQCPGGALREWPSLQVFSGVDGASAPGTGRKLVRRPDARPPGGVVRSASLLDGLRRVVGTVRCRPAANPQTDAEGVLPPAGVSLLEGCPADRLTGADQRGGALELLDGEQPQGVPHEYCNTVVARPAGNRAL